MARLHVIVDLEPGGDGVALAGCVAAAGAPLIQLRAKQGTDAERWPLIEAGTAAVARHGAQVVVNDRADLCVAVGAHGVHGGADDLGPRQLRAVVGPDRLVGATARDPEAARALEAAGADYLGVGPVYATTSKMGLPDPIGPAMVERVAAAVAIPVIAVAGITAERVPEVLAAGAHGVAVIGAVARADDPAEATRHLLDLVARP